MLDIDDLGTFLIAPDQMAAGRVDSAARPLAVEHAAEMILGPLLTPLFAERGIFCLHASAVLTPHGALVFVGDSGAGKSTLAAWLAGNTGDWLLTADDVLAVTLRGDRLVAFTDYPQLKLPRDQQPALTSPGTVPVAAVIVLQEPDADVGLVKQTGASSAAAFSKHTVASRLFHPRLLAHHFAFCSSAAARSRVYHLIYPREHAALPEVAARLSSVLH